MLNIAEQRPPVMRLRRLTPRSHSLAHGDDLVESHDRTQLPWESLGGAPQIFGQKSRIACPYRKTVHLRGG
jgi:hypothetical protein